MRLIMFIILIQTLLFINPLIRILRDKERKRYTDADIKAYTDNTFKTAIDDTKALAAGNRIVIVDNGIYATYTVVGEVAETTYLINNPDGLELSMSRAVTQSNGQYALGGQGSTDTSTYLKFQGWDGTNDDMFYQYQYPEEYIGVGKTVSFNLDMYYTYSQNSKLNYHYSEYLSSYI